MDESLRQQHRHPHEPPAPAQQQQPLRAMDLPGAFLNDPAVYLASIASEAPSRHGLASLAGGVAEWFVAAAAAADAGTPGLDHHGGGPAAQVAGLYLQAAAVQLREATAAPTEGASATRASGDAAAREAANTRCQHETLGAVGAAATLCPNRMAIASSGILPTLAHLMAAPAMTMAAASSPHGASASFPHPAAAVAAVSSSSAAAAGGYAGSLQSALAQAGATSPSSSYPPLQQASVEFLQCAVLAEQYRYAARLVEGTWPCPNNTVSVKTVLRYFYIRGLVHLGCQDYGQAHRCWWACLSVPAEICSAIMIQAWKKLVLVQPLLDRHRGTVNAYNNNNNNGGRPEVDNETGLGRGGHPAPTKGGAAATRLPKAMPKCMTRLLVTAKESHDTSILLYTWLGPAVEAGQPDVVQSLIRTHEALLVADGNRGLAQDCLRRAEDVQVWRDSQLFSVVPVGQLARRWGVAPEHVPRRLVDSKVPYRIEEDGMVVFVVAGAREDENEAPTRPSAWMGLSEWMQLLERVQELDVNISVSSAYHSLVRKEEKGGPGADAGGASGPRGVEDF